MCEIEALDYMTELIVVYLIRRMSSENMLNKIEPESLLFCTFVSGKCPLNAQK